MSTKVNVRLPEDLHAAIVAKAAQTKQSASEVMIDAMRTGLAALNGTVQPRVAAISAAVPSVKPASSLPNTAADPYARPKHLPGCHCYTCQPPK
jgi:hypothetical protein